MTFPASVFSFRTCETGDQAESLLATPGDCLDLIRAYHPPSPLSETTGEGNQHRNAVMIQGQSQTSLKKRNKSMKMRKFAIKHIQADIQVEFILYQTSCRSISF